MTDDPRDPRRLDSLGEPLARWQPLYARLVAARRRWARRWAILRLRRCGACGGYHARARR